LAHRCHMPTKSLVPHVFKGVAVLTGLVRHHRLVSTVSAVAPLHAGRRHSSLPHCLFASRWSTLTRHPAAAWLPHQCCPMLPLRHRRARAASLLGSPAPPSSESPTSSSLTCRRGPCAVSTHSTPMSTTSHPYCLHIGCS
jgi:hypothetical protein